MIREWYTHIGGQPTRLQASTRYINYEHGFDYVTPASIAERSAAKAVYDELMADTISEYQERLWEKTDLTDYEDVKTNTFFKVYESYFGDGE